MINKKELRCAHRHSIKTHPSCFAKGLIDYRNEKEFTKKTGLPWWTYPGNKIGFLDIETDGLKSDFSTMLTWAIKERGGKIVYDVINKKELFDLEFDKRLIESIIREISNYKIIVGYFSLGFDLPYIRTKALHYDIPFPNYGDIYSFDLYYLVRSKLNLSKKSLESVCDYLNIDGKTFINRSAWRKAKYGDPKSLQEVLDHNIYDCEITEKLYEKLLTQSKWTKRSI